MKVKKIYKKTFSEKTISRIVSLIVHGRDDKKQNLKIKRLVFSATFFHKKLSQGSYQLGYTRKIKNSKLGRGKFYEKFYSQWTILIIASMRVHRRDIKKLNSEKKDIFLIILVLPKTLPKIVSVIVHRKDIKKRISKIKKLIPIENHIHKNLSRRPYQ